MRLGSILLSAFLIFVSFELIAYANESTSYLDTVNALRGEIKYDYLLSHLEVLNDEYSDTIQHYSKEGMKWANQNHNDRVRGISFLLMGDFFVSKRKFDSAFHHLVMSEKYLELSKDSLNLGRIYNIMGYVYLELGLRHEAIEAIEKALKVAYGKGFDVWYISKSNIASELLYREPEQAEKILKELTDTLEKRGSSRLGSVYNKWAVLKRKGDSAIFFHERAIAFNRSNNNKRDLTVSITLFGTLHREMEQYDKAISHYLQSLSLAKELENRKELFHIYMGLSKTYKSRNLHDSARLYIDSMRLLVRNYQLPPNAKSNLLITEMNQFYEEGRYKEAYETFSHLAYYRDTLDRQTATQLAIVLNLKMDDQEKDWKISLLREANKVQKWKFRVLITAIACIAVFIGLGFLAYLRKKKNERVIFELQLEKERERKKRLELENQQKKKELISKSLQLSKKNQFLEDLQAEINQAIKDEAAGDYIKLRNLIKINHSSEKEWEEIRSYFDQLSPKFFDTLENKSTTLSQADKKLAALIHLRIDNQDAANILNIARSSVKTARYRLKKKLGLANEDSLDVYLMNLG